MGRKSQTKNMTNDQKKAICEYANHQPKLPQEAVARWAQIEFGLANKPSQSTISKILKRKRELLVMPPKELNCKRKRKLRFPQLEQALIDWILHCKRQHVRVTGEAIKEKASQLVEELQLAKVNAHDDPMTAGHGNATSTSRRRPTFSNGWLQAFKVRNDFLELGRDQTRDKAQACGGNGHGLGASGMTTSALSHAETDHDAEEELEEPKETGNHTPKLVFSPHPLQQQQRGQSQQQNATLALMGQFEPRNIYSMVETGLFYAWNPCVAVDKWTSNSFLTLLLCVNADASDFVPPFYIGGWSKPRCFGGKSALELGLRYTSNKHAQVCASVVRQWLVQLDDQMRQQDRHILLFVDDLKAHRMANLTLTNVTLGLLQGNESTKHLHPLVGGVVTAFKRRYRRACLEIALDRQEEMRTDLFQVSVLQAMRWASKCWNGLPLALVQDAFRRNLGIPTQESTGQVDQYLEQSIESAIMRLLQRLKVRASVSLNDIVAPAAENIVWNEDYDQDQGVECLEEGRENPQEDQEVTTKNNADRRSQLKSLRQVIRLAYESDECSLSTIQDLRRLQTILRER